MALGAAPASRLPDWSGLLDRDDRKKYSVQAGGLNAAFAVHPRGPGRVFTKGCVGEPSVRENQPGEKNAGKRTRKPWSPVQTARYRESNTASNPHTIRRPRRKTGTTRLEKTIEPQLR